MMYNHVSDVDIVSDLQNSHAVAYTPEVTSLFAHIEKTHR